MGHLRFLRREDLRWQRGDVIIVGCYLFLIRGWAIVRRPVPLVSCMCTNDFYVTEKIQEIFWGLIFLLPRNPVSFQQLNP
jgi:hypothetical protein